MISVSNDGEITVKELWKGEKRTTIYATPLDHQLNENRWQKSRIYRSLTSNALIFFVVIELSQQPKRLGQLNVIVGSLHSGQFVDVFDVAVVEHFQLFQLLVGTEIRPLALSSEIILKSLSFFFFPRNDFELVHTSVECSEESNRSLD